MNAILLISLNFMQESGNVYMDELFHISPVWVVVYYNCPVKIGQL